LGWFDRAAAASVSPPSSEAAPDAALDVRDLGLEYGPVQALSDITLTVARGEFVALLGPSGCGKTSLLRSVAGFAHPQRGRIAINGADVLGLPARRRNIGMVFQNYALFPHLTAAQNVRFGLRCRRTPAAKADRLVSDILEVVGLRDLGDRLPAQLSGGQQQRVALARALVIQPSLLLLDEALGALDRKLRVEMQAELKALQRRFMIATVFVTHDQEEAMAMADRIAVIRNGRIEQLDTPRELFLRPRDGWVADFMGAGNLLPGRIGPADAQGNRTFEVGAGCAFSVSAGPADGASIYVRSDRVQLRLVAPGEAGLAIVARRFLGAQVELQAQSEHSLVRALIPIEHADGFEIGRNVAASAKPEDCLLLSS
jgi:ABC-type Fe3+/spermidine/putrescine transport system ATPase subunit